MNRLITFFVFIALVFCMRCAYTTQNLDKNIKAKLSKSFADLKSETNQFRQVTADGNSARIKQAFHRCRNAYKKVEWFTEFYMPGASKLLNGAPLPEIEIEETKTFAPAGLQVIEEYIYSEDGFAKQDLLREIDLFAAKLKLAENIVNDLNFTKQQIIEACKMEVFRIITMGISGFDTPLSQTGVAEADHALAGIANVLQSLEGVDELDGLITQGRNYVRKAPDFDGFDRMIFIRQYAAPITRALVLWQKRNKVEPGQELALKRDVSSLFDDDLFNRDFFADNAESFYSNEKAALGKALFSDPILSGKSRTCRSCHNPQLAFTDGIAKSSAIIPGTFVKRNAPTLLYSSLQQAQFYDMGSPSLEDQAGDVLANKDEMHASAELAAARLSSDAKYKKLFKAAFPSMSDLKPRYVTIALASYLRSLTPFSSNFDKYMRGDNTKLNEEEVKGFNLFMGKAKCGTCHFMPVFNGTAPPSFTNTEGEVLGVPETPKRKILDKDLGRFAHNKLKELKSSFKTPTLRNVAITAPYMHNGAFKSLEEVLEFYNNGGGLGLGIKVDNQTLPSEPLKLDEQEQKAIISFLKSLTDDGFLKPDVNI